MVILKKWIILDDNCNIADFPANNSALFVVKQKIDKTENGGTKDVHFLLIKVTFGELLRCH